MTATRAQKTQTADIQNTLTFGQQDVCLQVVTKIAGHKVQISIKSNAYESQCSAVAHVWSQAELKWNRVASIPALAMKTGAGLCYHQKGRVTVANFVADRVELERLVLAVLG